MTRRSRLLRVLSVFLLILVLSVSAVGGVSATGDGGGEHPGAFELLTPENGAHFASESEVIEFSWSISEGAAKYKFELESEREGGEDPSTGNVGQSVEVLVDAVNICTDALCSLAVDSTIGAVLGNGFWKWKVFAFNEVGERWAANGPFFFTIGEDDGGDDDAGEPGPFELLTPENGAHFTNLDDLTSFTWSVSEGATHYEFELERKMVTVENAEQVTHAHDEHEIVDLLLTAADFCTDSICGLAVGDDIRELLADGLYRWKVEAIAGDEDRGAANNPFYFTVRTGDVEPPPPPADEPGPFELLTPPNGTIFTELPGVTTTTQLNGLTMTWTVSEGARFYRFEIKKLGGHPRRIVKVYLDANDICEGDVCGFTIPENAMYLLSSGSYRWDVKAYTMRGKDTESSNGPFIFTVDIPKPQLPIITIILNQGRPKLKWLLDRHALWFFVYVGTKEGVPVHLAWHHRHEFKCEGSGHCFIPIDLLSGEYEVWVLSWGIGGFSSGGFQGWAGPFKFIVPSTPPPLPTALSVANTATAAPTFSWQGSEQATWYQIWVGQISPLNTVHWSWYSADELGCGGGGICTLPVELDAPLPAGDYQWFVQAWGAGGFAPGGIANLGWVGSEFTIEP